MSAQHTPGPWIVSASRADTVVQALGPPLARAYAPLFHGARQSQANAAAKANARLIAAAPDMKEALTVANRVFQFDLKRLITFGPDYNQAVKDAADAVAAALAKSEAL